MSKFNDEQMNRFVHLYERHECLWNTNSPQYKDKSERNLALKDIVTEMDIANFGAMDCKNKIKNMRSHYCQELKKIRMSRIKDGSVYKPKLQWFDPLNAYLRKYVHLNAASSTKSEETTTESQLNDSTDQPVNTMPKGEANNNIEMDAGFQDQETCFKNSRLPTATKKRRLEKRKPQMSPSSLSSTTTEFDVFGKSVAAQLNNIPIEDAMKLQLQIQQLISHHRLKLYKRKLPPQKKRVTKNNLKNAGAVTSFDLECDVKSENEFSEEPWDDTVIRYPTKYDEESGGQVGPIHGHEIFFTEVEPKLEPEEDMDDL